jgi:hypothetical protein
MRNYEPRENSESSIETKTVRAKRYRAKKWETIFVKYEGIFLMELRKELDEETGKKMYRIIDIHLIS